MTPKGQPRIGKTQKDGRLVSVKESRVIFSEKNAPPKRRTKASIRQEEAGANLGAKIKLLGQIRAGLRDANVDMR